MSIWAQKWAYEQSVTNSGAKFVLVALANFADEEGNCWPSQPTIARMTGQSVRTVRSHLKNLEEGGYISREGRRRQNGSYSSDYFQLLTASENLRPCPAPAAKKPASDQRQNPPAADFASGEKQQHQRQETTLHLRQKTSPPAAKFAAPEPSLIQPSVKQPSEEPLTAQRTRAREAPDAFIAELQLNLAYQSINVEAEYHKMLAWCSANYAKPTRRRFVNWLNRIDVLPAAAARAAPSDNTRQETPEEKQARLYEYFYGTKETNAARPQQQPSA